MSGRPKRPYAGYFDRLAGERESQNGLLLGNPVLDGQHDRPLLGLRTDFTPKLSTFGHHVSLHVGQVPGSVHSQRKQLRLCDRQCLHHRTDLRDGVLNLHCSGFPDSPIQPIRFLQNRYHYAIISGRIVE